MFNFKTGKEPKMNVIDFGAFQEKSKMPSRDKILRHMLFGALHGTSRISFRHFVQKSDFLTFRCISGIFIQNGAPRCSKNEHNNLNNIYFVPGQVRRVCKDDKEIKLNHVLAHEQNAMVVYICILHIVAILVDDIPNGGSPLDNQNSDKGFLVVVLHSYSICVP